MRSGVIFPGGSAFPMIIAGTGGCAERAAPVASLRLTKKTRDSRLVNPISGTLTSFSISNGAKFKVSDWAA